MILSTLAAGLFWGIYRLLMSGDRWLQCSRAYLCVTMLFSLTFPAIKLAAPIAATTIDIPVINVVATQSTTDGVAAPAMAWFWTPVAVYIIGVVVALGLLLLQFVQIMLKLRHLPYERQGRVKLTLLDDDTVPYSFFNHIVIGTQGLNNSELRCILAHEELHVRQGHTHDVLTMRLMCCMGWFNPFAWLMAKELRAVHEYLADDAVLSAHGRKEYAELLFREATSVGYGHITNNFKSINIKKRIVMMNKTKTRYGAWKALSALPVALAMLMVGNMSVNAQEVKRATPTANASNYEVFTVVEENPEFDGGMEGLYKYLSSNIHYPEKAKEEKIQGRVFVTFVIEKDGSVSDAKVIRGIGGGCDEEALRVVNNMPKWKPGKQKGKPVRVQYNLPIYFQLK